MWIHKYKPKTFSEVKGNVEVVKMLQRMVEKGRYSHIILHGPPGVGKTTLVDIFVNTLLQNKKDEAFFYSGSCDDRSIHVLREKLNEFVPKKVSLPPGVPKIVVFDMSETLSDGIQHIMRRLMEKHLHHCVFFFVCPTIDGIIETIQSRCLLIRMHHVSETDQASLVAEIAATEGITIEPAACSLLLRISGGDLRYTLNHLEVCALLQKTVSETIVREICLSPHIEVFENFLKNLREETKDLKMFCREIQRLYKEGLNGIDILMLFAEVIHLQEEWDRSTRLHMTHLIAETHSRIVNSVDTPLFLMDLMCQLSQR